MTEIIEKSSSPRTVLAALILAAGLQGCASTGTSIPIAVPASKALLAPESVTVSNDLITIANLLSWPLEGRAGNDRLVNALGKLWTLQPRQGDQHDGEGPARLADGYVLSMAMIRMRSGAADIGVASEPCLTPAKAAMLSGAMLDPIIQDAHGVDRGRHYRSVRAGVALTFNTTPETYACVTSIHLRPEAR